MGKEIEKEKLKLTIPETEFKGTEQFRDLKLNLNGHKKRSGRNLYKKQLNRLKRLLR